MKPCSQAGCPALVEKGGYCPRHHRARMHRYDAGRGTRTTRGYSNAWARYSADRLTRYPLCVICGRLAEVTDHIESARAAPARFWDPSNHQSLCRHCNSRKAIATEGGFGRAPRRDRS